MPDTASAPVATIRAAGPQDAEGIARLAVQLGYDVTPDDVRGRLPSVQAQAGAELLVAADASGAVMGWLHVELKRSLLTEPTAQVMGLVVEEQHRSGGIGAALLEAAEAWAARAGCELMLVGTRVTRERAHGFYRRQGYELWKTSHFFHKRLP